MFSLEKKRDKNIKVMWIKNKRLWTRFGVESVTSSMNFIEIDFKK